MTTVVQAIAKAAEATKAVRKGQKNAQQGYTFRGVDDIVKAAKPALIAQGVVVVPIEVTTAYETVEVGAKRTPMLHARLSVLYRAYGPEGDHIVIAVAAEAMDSGDKATAKAMSVAWRTALVQLLQIATGDPEPDAQSYERSGRLTAKQVMTVVRRARGNRERLLELHAQADREGLLGEQVANENDDIETLGDLIVRWGKEAAQTRVIQRTPVPETTIEAAWPEPALTGGQ